jgi:hypothetical protein
LKELTVSISVEEHGWNRQYVSSLKDIIRMLCKFVESRKTEIWDLLSELLIHPANHVRATVAVLFNAIVCNKRAGGGA